MIAGTVRLGSANRESEVWIRCRGWTQRTIFQFRPDRIPSGGAWDGSKPRWLGAAPKRTLMTLSPAAVIVLTRAAEHPDHLLEFQRKLPAVARRKMIDALLRDGIITETAGDFRFASMFEDASTGMLLTTLRITNAGLRSLNLDPPDAQETSATDVPAVVAQEAAAAEVLDTAPVAPTDRRVARTALHHAAQAVLEAWDNGGNREVDMVAALEAPMASLRAVYAERSQRAAGTGAPRKPREGTKKVTVMTMLRRTEGASGPQIAEATGWASHTVRGFLAGLKKKGINVETLERVRIVGPNKEGAKGSFSIYHVATAV